MKLIHRYIMMGGYRKVSLGEIPDYAVINASGSYIVHNGQYVVHEIIPEGTAVPPSGIPLVSADGNYVVPA